MIRRTNSFAHVSRRRARRSACRQGARRRDAQTSPLRAQVLLVDALADLLLATGYCESPLEADAARSPDTDVFKQAITKFTAGLAAAQAITGDDAAKTKVDERGVCRPRSRQPDGGELRRREGQCAGGGRPASSTTPSTRKAAAIDAELDPGQQFHQNRNRSGGLRRMYHSRVHVIDSLGDR